MEVSIIIVNYNTKNLLSNCLRSIYKHTKNVSFEIIVVDNASVDKSQEYIQANFPQVVFITSEENLGFGLANNLGAKQAKGDFFKFGYYSR